MAVLCNVASANATQLGHQVADIYLESLVRPHPHEIAAPGPATLEAKAGLYRSVRDHQTLSVEYQDGKLRIDRRGVLTPVASDVFSLGEDSLRAEFKRDASGKTIRLQVASEVDEGNYYERVERWNPSPAELEGMTGEYSSEEAEVTFHVALEKDHLVIHRRPDGAIALTPTYRDGFSSSLGSVRFLRDAAGRISELSVGEQRVWDMRFRRVR